MRKYPPAHTPSLSFDVQTPIPPQFCPRPSSQHRCMTKKEDCCHQAKQYAECFQDLEPDAVCVLPAVYTEKEKHVQWLGADVVSERIPELSAGQKKASAVAYSANDGTPHAKKWMMPRDPDVLAMWTEELRSLARGSARGYAAELLRSQPSKKRNGPSGGEAGPEPRTGPSKAKAAAADGPSWIGLEVGPLKDLGGRYKRNAPKQKKSWRGRP